MNPCCLLLITQSNALNLRPLNKCETQATTLAIQEVMQQNWQFDEGSYKIISEKKTVQICP